MKTIQQDVLEIDVYDENGKFITDLHFTRQVKIRTADKDNETHLYIEDATQNTNMLELLGNKITQSLSDFDKNSFATPEVNTIKFSKNPKPVKLKIVGTGIDYNLDTAEVEHDIKFIFPNVRLIRDNEFTFSHGEGSIPTYKFEVLPYDEDDNLYDIQLKKRKDK